MDNAVGALSIRDTTFVNAAAKAMSVIGVKNGVYTVEDIWMPKD